MSHFTTLSKVNVVDAEAFIKAAKELGFTEVHKNAKMNGYMGNTQQADVVVRKAGCPYDIGLVKNGSKYDVVSDWWGARQYCADVENKISQLTAKHTIARKYAKLGFMTQTSVDKKGNIILNLTR